MTTTTRHRGIISSAEYQPIADRFRSARVAAGLTLEELGGALGCSGQQAAKYSNGDNRLPIGALPRIRRALGVSYEWLIDGPDADPTQDLPDRRLVLEICGAVNRIARGPRAERDLRALAKITDGLADAAASSGPERPAPRSGAGADGRPPRGQW